MKLLTDNEMVERLTEIFDIRLKALIGHSDTEFTREIATYMFAHCDKLGEDKDYKVFKEQYRRYLSNVLAYHPGNDPIYDDAIGYHVNRLTMNIENYVKASNRLLDPEWDKPNGRSDGKDYRKYLGTRFSQDVMNNRDKYPENLRPADFLSQLNYTTMYRNKFAHNHQAGNSGMYPRHVILLAYDVILSLLLYTFYYMALTPDYEMKHLNG